MTSITAQTWLIKTDRMKNNRLFRSFQYAFSGLLHFIRNDRNGRIHFSIILLVIAAAWYYRVSATEWVALLLCCSIVPSLEMCNHALEELCNKVQPGIDPRIRIVKDVAAAAVIWAAIISVIIGLIIFIPRVF